MYMIWTKEMQEEGAYVEVMDLALAKALMESYNVDQNENLYIVYYWDFFSTTSDKEIQAL